MLLLCAKQVVLIPAHICVLVLISVCADTLQAGQQLLLHTQENTQSITDHVLSLVDRLMGKTKVFQWARKRSKKGTESSQNQRVFAGVFLPITNHAILFSIRLLLCSASVSLPASPHPGGGLCLGGYLCCLLCSERPHPECERHSYGQTDSRTEEASRCNAQGELSQCS